MVESVLTIKISVLVFCRPSDSWVLSGGVHGAADCCIADTLPQPFDKCRPSRTWAAPRAKNIFVTLSGFETLSAVANSNA
jgi:hypothetical protein